VQNNLQGTIIQVTIPSPLERQALRNHNTDTKWGLKLREEKNPCPLESFGIFVNERTRLIERDGILDHQLQIPLQVIQ
jgi:hypothetical protein